MELEVARRILVDHSRSKKNGVLCQDGSHRHRLLNAKCGDQVEIVLKLVDGIIEDISYSAKGCAICMASSSLLCQELGGLSLANAIKILKDFVRAVQIPTGEWPISAMNLRCFEHLRVNPARKNCALLAWLAFERALASPQAP